jgi:hypothetical protein
MNKTISGLALILLPDQAKISHDPTGGAVSGRRPASSIGGCSRRLEKASIRLSNFNRFLKHLNYCVWFDPRLECDRDGWRFNFSARDPAALSPRFRYSIR